MQPTDLSSVQQFDQAVDRAFDPLRESTAANRLFYTLSELGDFSLIWHVIGSGLALREGNANRSLRLAVSLGVESVLVNGVIKSFFRRERPVIDVPRPLRLRQPRSSSFPSGHASSAFTAAVLLSEDSRVGPLWFGLASMIAASRIHVRIHHGSDVVGGVITGLVLGSIGRRLWPLERPPLG